MSPRRLIAVAGLAALLGCVTQKGAQTEQTKEEKQKVINITYFDLAACHPGQLALPSMVTKEIVLGVLVGARPQVMECLVPPSARGEKDTTTVNVKATVTEKGTELAVTGENLTADGEKCIRDALALATQSLKLTPPEPVIPAADTKAAEAKAKGKGKAKKDEPAATPAPPPAPAAQEPVVAEAQFTHTKTLPTVTMNKNASSDLVGQIRLGMPQWCECYAEWKDSPPRPLKAKIVVLRAEKPVAEAGKEPAADAKPPEKVSPTEVTFEPTADPKADAVAACLQKKISAMQFNNPEGKELSIGGLPFYFVHSGITQPLDATVDGYYRFVHLDGLRGQTTAQAAIALGARTFAVSVYDNLVQRYKDSKGKAWELITPMKEKCAALLAADDTWTGALEQQLKIDQQTLDLTTELKAAQKDWESAAVQAQKQVEESVTQLAEAKKIREQDAGVCPKEKK